MLVDDRRGNVDSILPQEVLGLEHFAGCVVGLDGCVLVLGETFCACAEHDIVWMLILNC